MRRQQFAKRVRQGAQRSPEDSNLPDNDDLDFLSNLEYFSLDKDEFDGPSRGFWAKTKGDIIMAAMMEFLKINDIEYKTSDTHFGLDFNWVEKAEVF